MKKLLWIVLAALVITTGAWGQGNLDAVFANLNERNRVCVGDSSGNFGCGDVSTDANNTYGVALGEVVFSQIFTDGFESGDASAWSGSVA